MSILNSLLGGSYIDIVKKYLDKIFKHEAKLSDHFDSEIDLTIRKVDGKMRIFILSRTENRLLRELSDKECEQILTGKE